MGSHRRRRYVSRILEITYRACHGLLLDWQSDALSTHIKFLHYHDTIWYSATKTIILGLGHDMFEIFVHCIKLSGRSVHA